jgi:hypothetical protein
MAIARNKKNHPVDPAAIAAFGAAAEMRDATAASAVAVETPKTSSTNRKPRVAGASGAAADGPASSLIRWKGHEELRDRIKGYATEERYSEQDVMIRALRLGMEQIEGS